ncbi:hypothetical protein SAMN05444396_103354 [Flavobacterium segetis]|uniref:Outer membrane protein beta-barrel domain-containing protein n=1 Tax=Flavobacterium segetis TaxID=271157 RepID=A0A1M5G9J5_9FLAO|nr:PorT family protein [Flavobacterium segetis]SHG00142.1 hypothetical protein SAMN05444396_103354 [Flavobacterium segetis]
MKNSKNIDRLFQEQFKDFEAKPNDQTWCIIQAGLMEKKERKIIPIWLKYAGIAVTLLFGLLALNTMYQSNNEIINKIVIDSKTTNSKKQLIDSVSKQNKEIEKSNDLKNKYKIVKNNLQTIKEDEKQNTTLRKAETVFFKNSNQKSASLYNRKNHQSIKPENDPATNSKNELFINDKNPVEKNFVVQNRIILENKKSVAIEKGILALAKVNPTPENNSNGEPENELEAVLKKKTTKEDIVVTVVKNKWQVTPTVAALFTNSNAVNIDPQFSENAKTTDNKLSYGIRVNYALNKKFTIRSGINKIAVGYNTNNVTYSAGLNAMSLANVKFNNATVEISSNAGKSSLMTFERNLQKTNTGTINQSMSYYEIPLEISYSLLDKKVGIHVIGGVSTLLLDTNKIALISSETNQQIGQANNLNSTHFSSNIGIGFNYKFVKSFQFNFEPMIKYQMNTFSNKANSTPPILIGLYSGISYSF